MLRFEFSALYTFSQFSQTILRFSGYCANVSVLIAGFIGGGGGVSAGLPGREVTLRSGSRPRNSPTLNLRNAANCDFCFLCFCAD